MIVLPGPASPNLANRLASELRAKIVPLSFRKFPDGENYIRIEASVQGKDIVIVQTTGPPQDERLMQLFLLASAAKHQGARLIETVIPYFAYSRQDKVFLPGEAFSARTVVDLLKACGVSRIITVDCHNPEVLQSLKIKTEILSAIPLLAQHIKSLGNDGAFSVSMGKKGLATAKEAAYVLNGGYDFIQTKRDRLTGKVTIKQTPLKVKGKTVIIFDDIISTGGTMMKAVKHVVDQGALEVKVACVHPLLTLDTHQKILQSGANEIIGTDTIPNPISTVSIAPLIAKALIR